MSDEPFILDMESNPHPRMLEGATRRRRMAHLSNEPLLGIIWLTYLDAMCDATGLPQLLRWLNPVQPNFWGVA